ncbi:hypothetical protein OBBRIDRAFT_793353 [Obba rivulosa]|uniref:DUF6535 domain-containing protein n=1 Tax=Obba rivulosa TaxID=1052685 RepID=A0A8E2DJF9_9APHY|nr:hypothetical protein OBBRIDRAFT_793353 [Obba rivulosa]
MAEIWLTRTVVTSSDADAEPVHRQVKGVESHSHLEEKSQEIESDGPAPSKNTAQQAGDDGWKECAKQLQKHDEAIVKAWKEEIDALLVFAGLFSAVLTAFNVQVYTSLSPNSTQDLSAQILLHISTQLGGPSTRIGVDDAVMPAFVLSADAEKVPKSSIWINALWFASLILSLATASVGITVRQWLNHFVSPTSSDPRQSVSIHCLRYDQGLIRWRVPEILGVLPVLIQLALVFFFIGLVILLWTLDTVVASITTSLVAILLLFLLFTTFTPSIRPDCAYKSPQALLFYWLVQKSTTLPLVRMLRSGIIGARKMLSYYSSFTTRKRPSSQDIEEGTGVHNTINSRPSSPWSIHRPNAPSIMSRTSRLDNFVVSSGGSVRKWGRMVSKIVALISRTLIYPFVGNLRVRTHANWRALEQAIVSEQYSASLVDWVNINALSCADQLLLDDSFLYNVAVPCLLDPQQTRGTLLGRLRPLIRGRSSMPARFAKAVLEISVDLLPHISDECGMDDIEELLSFLDKHVTFYGDEKILQKVVLGCANFCTLEDWRGGGCCERAMALLMKIANDERWIIGDASADAPISILPKYQAIKYLIRRLDQQISPWQLKHGLKQTLNSCVLVLHLTSLVPVQCYDQHLRRDITALMSELCFAIRCQAWKKSPDAQDLFVWGKFFKAASRVIQSSGDDELRRQFQINLIKPFHGIPLLKELFLLHFPLPSLPQ